MSLTARENVLPGRVSLNACRRLRASVDFAVLLLLVFCIILIMSSTLGMVVPASSSGIVMI